MKYHIEYLHPADAFMEEQWIRAGMWSNYESMEKAQEDLIRYKKFAMKMGFFAKDFRIVETAE